MSNIFEQPWTLLTGAVLCLVVIITVRQAFPEKRRTWQFAIPAIVAMAAFGFDILVQTNLEKINTLIKTGMDAVENEMPDNIGALISPDYRDSYHDSKKTLMAHTRNLLSGLKVERNKKLDLQIEISEATATAHLKVMTIFDEQSLPSHFPARFLITKLKLNLTKGSRKKWLIECAEVLEINNNRVGWTDVSYRSY
jgi:hypothetical protein